MVRNSNNMAKFVNDTYLQNVIKTYSEGTPIVINEIVEHINKKSISVNTKVSQLSSLKKILKMNL